MKAWKWAIAISIILTTSGCALSKGTVRESRSKVVDTYLEAVSKGRTDSADYIRDNLKIGKAFGYVKPYAPVITAPDVRLVWIPPHKSKEDPNTLIMGHWVYIVVRESRWFIDSQKDSKVKIPLIVPYKETGRK